MTWWHIISYWCHNTLWSPSVKHPKTWSRIISNSCFSMSEAAYPIERWAGRPQPAAVTACSGQCPAGPPAEWGTCQRWRFKTPKANICGGNRLTFQTFPCPGPARGPASVRVPTIDPALAWTTWIKEKKKREEVKLSLMWSQCQWRVCDVCRDKRTLIPPTVVVQPYSPEDIMDFSEAGKLGLTSCKQHARLC